MNSVHLTAIAVAALLSENFILVSCMGIGTKLEAFREPREARRTGFSVLLTMVLTVFLSWLADNMILRHYGWEHLRLMTFTLISLGSVALLRLSFHTFLPGMAHRLDDSLSSMSTNCSALGAALLSSIRGYELDQALAFALFGGLGVMICLLCFSGLRDAVDFDECPKPFRGAPIMLITDGLMALSLVGFYGLHIS